MGSEKVGHDWASFTFHFTAIQKWNHVPNTCFKVIIRPRGLEGLLTFTHLSGHRWQRWWSSAAAAKAQASPEVLSWSSLALLTRPLTHEILLLVLHPREVRPHWTFPSLPLCILTLFSLVLLCLCHALALALMAQLPHSCPCACVVPLFTTAEQGWVCVLVGLESRCSAAVCWAHSSGCSTSRLGGSWDTLESAQSTLPAALSPEEHVKFCKGTELE